MTDRVRTGIDRREFLVGGAVVGAGLLGAPALADAEPRVRRYVPLGRTGFEISDVSFGSSRMKDPKVVRHAYERGINYFDGAEGYKGGASEEAIGEALHDVRDRVFITSKTKAGAQTRQAEMMEALEGSLKRLRTDYVDVYFNHAVNDVERMANPEWREFTEKAKQQGKIRYRGMSGHAGRLTQCLEYSLDHDLVDVILVAYNFGQDPAFYNKLLNTFDFITLQPDLPPLLTRAREAGVGVVAMKTLMGARMNDMRPWESGGATFAQAGLRWTLSNPDVHALVISMNDPSMVDEFLVASGSGPVRAGEVRLLERYLAMQGGRYCQHGCDACHASCPSGVAVSEVLRTRMYDVDYGDPSFARSEYAALGSAASACLACTSTPCAGACPNGIAIPEYTKDAATRLG